MYMCPVYYRLRMSLMATQTKMTIMMKPIKIQSAVLNPNMVPLWFLSGVPGWKLTNSA